MALLALLALSTFGTFGTFGTLTVQAVYIEYARHGENTGLLFGTFSTWHLALGTFGTFGTWHLALGTNSYCSSEGKNGPDKKSTASSQKKFG